MYSDAKVIADQLVRIPVYINLPNGDVIETTWLAAVYHTPGSGVLELEFRDTLKPYLLQLKSRYVVLPLPVLFSLRSKYSLRLYEICVTLAWQSPITFSIEE